MKVFLIAVEICIFNSVIAGSSGGAKLAVPSDKTVDVVFGRKTVHGKSVSSSRLNQHSHIVGGEFINVFDVISY